ncbi:MAG TPA: hypothetical protein VJM12_10430 [Pyrinomonadaceae bacterium]|nr:hypothetical protein [Pyrinomonadaceae bacterium]
MRRNFQVHYLIVFSGLFVALSGCGVSPHPSDAVLVERFYAHRADFEKLVIMFNEDTDLVRITAKNAFLEKGGSRQLPKERLDEYHRLLKILRLNGGIQRDRDGIVLIASLKGLVTPNSA